MKSGELNFDALEICLDNVRHLTIDVARMKPELKYGEKRGGYGDVKVYTLGCGTSAKLVAAKTIRFKDRDNEPERLAFSLVRELAIWAKLQHPHILPLLGYHLGNDYENAILISEYMPNGDLKDYIEKENPAWMKRLALMIDATKGLRYLHNLNPPVCHADLKMRNILVTGGRRAVLADFGLSVALNDHPTGLSTTTGLRGTLRYYSPELVKEPSPRHSLASDIWALGCVLLEALTDIVPHAELKFEHSIILKLVEDKLPADVEGLPIPTPEVKELLTKCWSISPAERPSALQCLCYMRPAMRFRPSDSAEVEEFELLDFSPNAIYPGSPKRPRQKVATVTLRLPVGTCIVPSPQTTRTPQSPPSAKPRTGFEIAINKHIANPVLDIQTTVNRPERGGVENVVAANKAVEIKRTSRIVFQPGPSLPVARTEERENTCEKGQHQDQHDDAQGWNWAWGWFPMLAHPSKLGARIRNADPTVWNRNPRERDSGVAFAAYKFPPQLCQGDNLLLDRHNGAPSRHRKRLFNEVTEVPEEPGRKRPRL
ncbi:hypothetical protein M407DRAFT_19409 [Tulasnella calospora MUT 4182]|uniref:Protein kinase domain-containing protein n=1 Tax=Tulasnella calospora MUT 4182 TaxID=1051891 RepID=A0A0C3QI53_9AGAM|nr:hypothetical protein M407DRAFT_19409 [Tulasnella calospora MUT 4182]